MISSREIRNLVTMLLIQEQILVAVLFAGLVLSDIAVGSLSRAAGWVLLGIMTLISLILYAGVGWIMNRSVEDSVRRGVLTEAYLKSLYGNAMPRSRSKRLLVPAAQRIAGWLRNITTIVAWTLLLVIAIFGDEDDVLIRLCIGGGLIGVYIVLLFTINRTESLIFRGSSS